MFPVSFKSTAQLWIAPLVLAAAVVPAQGQQYEQALYDCVDAARSFGGVDYRKVDRQAQQNASVFEYWITNANDGEALRIYCRANNRTGKVEEIVMLADGAYRP